MFSAHIPTASGGPDAARLVGPVFLLCRFDQNRDEREAVEAAMKVYYAFAPRSGPQDQPEAPEKRRGRKPKHATPPPAPDQPQAPPELPSVLALTPELNGIDDWERGRSRAALITWINCTKRYAMANVWRARLASAGVKELVHPEEALAASSGRGALEAAEQTIRRKAVANREAAELAETEEERARRQPQEEPEEAEALAPALAVEPQFDPQTAGEPIDAEDEERRARVRLSPEEEKNLADALNAGGVEHAGD